MNEFYKLENDPKSKQELKKIIMHIRAKEEFERLNRICRCDEAGIPRCETCAKLKKINNGN